MTAAAQAFALDGPSSDAEPGHRIALRDGWSLWRLAALRSAGMPMAWLEAFAVPDAADDESDLRSRETSAAAVRHVVGQPAFVEAVTWQNPALVRNWLGRFAADLAAGGDGRLSRRDQREALVAFLAQRYCAKNETIGFFGPVAWARFGEDHEDVRTSGTARLRSRTLFREQWAVDAIARTFAARPELRPHLVARRHPACSFDGGVLRRPRRRPQPLDADEAVVAAALARPRQVGELLTACGTPEALDRLVTAGAVLVGLPIPVTDRPEDVLRGHVARIDDDRLRAGLAAELDRIDDAAAVVAASAGDPVALRDALERLGEEFRSLTGVGDQRAKTDRDLGRCIVYEDCRRDLDVDIGADLVDDLRAPLALLLDTARWLVAETGAEVERDLAAREASLREASGRPVALCDLVMASGDVLGGLPGTAVSRVAADFRARWAELLATATDASRLTTARLTPLVRLLFPSGPVRWRAARQHSPDMMLRERPGDRPQWVLGELHLAVNTLENRAFATQADDRAELVAATAADFPDGRFVPVLPARSPDVTSRTYPPLALDLPDRYRYWSWTDDEGHPSGRPTLPGAGLLVERDGDRLVVRSPDDGWHAPLVEVLGEFLTALVADRFSLRGPAPHHPRLMLDDVVVAREAWHLPVTELPDAPGDYRHRALRARLGELGMPRWVFARTPDQPKPYLVDRDAPLSLRNLARGLRRSAGSDPDATITFTEMLPAPDELWMAGPGGEPHTSELRIVVHDDGQPRSPLTAPDRTERG
ncbi:lantibiotic biosynthesis dehydratase-like protein [Mumia flava]|uniref:Lantibiotic biosynthesis dehydratase-like protein n=1 Tax=Mumia flava TaxID=1348852 RepID=A0A0B2B2E9_9ACTN|nr:lantibiotic dehydratase [Mumia flava]PJJ54093.1 lantibiotic biosynthesis dehydratase-like protein [Mumia flava]